jgi:hypothetical protein
LYECERDRTAFTRLHDPPQLARLVVGELPGAGMELGLRHCRDMTGVPTSGLYGQPRFGGLVIDDLIVAAQQGDDDLAAPHLDLELAVFLHLPILARNKKPAELPRRATAAGSGARSLQMV